jgi:hypothetical protein
MALNGAGMEFKNLAGPIDLGNGYTMHAPHVNGGGTICLGNVKDQFPELIRNREYAAAVQLAIVFLESVNVDDNWGQCINRFPIALETTVPQQLEEAPVSGGSEK